MKATPIEFRLRFLILCLIFILGFTAPWDLAWHLDSIRTWQTLAAWTARAHWLPFSTATIAVLALGIVLAVIAAWLRTWAAAYLGSSVVQDSSLHGETMVAAGPYRYLRNPLYLGTFIHTFALALLMPPTGAIVTIILVAVFQLRLIGAEESFLAHKLGQPYLAYRAAVPSIIPAMKPRVAASDVHPAWPTAFLGEIYMWGAAISFATLGWRYNAFLILQGILISLGLSLVVRAFLPTKKNL
jgi:protein-S-isoprenylcysteine O-methyltransferase Ste14